MPSTAKRSRCSQIARTTSIDLAIVELPRSAFPGPMPVVPLAVGAAKDGETVLTVGAQGGAAVSLQRGSVVRQTRGLIYYKPEALPGRFGSPLFNEEGTSVIGLVVWRTGDGHGLAMNAADHSFVRREVADVESELHDDAIPLWQSRLRLVLVTSAGCQPCELQKQSMPNDVRYETVDIQSVNAKGYSVRVTPTLMVFVDGKLQNTSSGILRGDRLQAFLARWGFSNRNEGDQPNDADLSDDLNPWSNPRRWERGTIRDRIDDAKTRFAWWLLGKWFGYCSAAVAFVAARLLLIRKWSNLPRPTAPKRRRIKRSATKART